MTTNVEASSSNQSEPDPLNHTKSTGSTEQTPLLTSSSEGSVPPTYGYINQFPTVCQPKLSSRWFILVVLFLMVLITVPSRVTQYMIDRTEMEILSVKISQATNETFQVEMRARVQPSMEVHATLLPTTVSVFYRGESLGQIPIPAIDTEELKSHQNQVILGGSFKISDEGLLSQFGIQLFQEEQLDWVIDGPLTVRALGVTFKSLRLKQTLTLSGMQGLRNVTVLGFELPENHPEGGVRILVHTLLHNPTYTSLDVGTVKYALEFEGLKLGIIEAREFQLIPGENQLELSGRLLPHAEERDMVKVSRFVSKFLKGESLDVVIRGLEVTPKVTWLENTIRSHVATIPFTNPSSQDFVNDIDILDLNTTFDSDTPFAPQIGAKIRATINAPFDFPYEIDTVTEKLGLRFHTNHSIMAIMNIPSSKAILETNGTTKAVTTQFQNAVLKVNHKDSNRRDFESFITEMVFANSSKVYVEGTLSAVINSALGRLNLTKIPLSVPMVFPGLNGMKDPPPQLTNLTVTGLQSGGVTFSAIAHIANPSSFSGYLGNVILKLHYQNQLMGWVTLTELNVKANATVPITTVGTLILPKCKPSGCYTPQDRARQTFLTRYITDPGELEVSATGFDSSTEVITLRPALSLLNYTMALPPSPSELLQTSKFRILKRAVELELTNPFLGVTVRILAIHAVAFSDGKNIGAIDIDFTTPSDPVRNPSGLDPIVLLPNATTATAPLPVQLLSIGLKIIKKALGGTLAVNLTIQATASLYPDLSHPLYLSFDQYNVTSQVEL